MIGLVWPLAKAPDLVSTLIVIVIVIISVVAQLINKAREVQKQMGRRKPPVQPPAPEEQDPLADEIEEFLKRAAQRRQTVAGGRPAPAPPPMAGVSETSSRRLVQAPVEAELIPIEGQPESVAAHVREHLSSAKFAPVSQQLGREVTEIDGKIERHLLEKFDHRLGRLAGMGGESASAQAAVDLEAPGQLVGGAATSLSALAALLANPASLRQAILLSEIFNRPESRWS